MSVLLTGASGYIGRATLEALVDRGVEVVAVSRREPDVTGSYQWVSADLLDAGSSSGLDAAALRALGATTVVHLAWAVEHGQFWTAEANLAWTAATLRFAQAACEAGISRFVGVGTCYEYDWPTHGDCHEEVTPLLPRNLYAVAKDATRRILQTYFDQHGRAFCWARPFFIYGGDEGHARLVPSLCRSLLSGDFARCSSGRARRDYLHVRDVGTALAALAEADMEGAVNIASGQNATIAEIATQIGLLARRPEMVLLGSLPDRMGEPPRITADSERIRSLGWKPSFLTLPEGLSAAFSEWQERMTHDASPVSVVKCH